MKWHIVWQQAAATTATLALAAGCGQAPSPPRAGSAVGAIAAAPESRKTEAPPSAPWQPVRRRVDLGRERVSEEARRIAEWVADSDDHRDLPFVIVDKVHARVLAFSADAKLLGSAPALLGLAHGDDSVPGIGERKIADIRPEERTTPAGRFVAEMGVNNHGEDILWVDYDAAVSMHRVRATNPAERRLERLASPSPADNRISYGCINLPAAFYDGVVKPLFTPRNGIVYVLPESRPVREFFGAYAVARGADLKHVSVR